MSSYTLIASEEKISDNTMNYILNNILNIEFENYKKENLTPNGYIIQFGTNIIKIQYVNRYNIHGQAFPDINIYLHCNSLNKIDNILQNQPNIVIEVTKNDTGDAGNMVYQRLIKFHKLNKNILKFIIYEINNINSSLNSHYVKIAILFASQFNIKFVFIRIQNKIDEHIIEITENNMINLEEYNESEKLKIVEYTINSTRSCSGTNNRLYRPKYLVKDNNRILARVCPNYKTNTSLLISEKVIHSILKIINNKSSRKKDFLEICKNFNQKYNANISTSPSKTIEYLKKNIEHHYDLTPECIDNRYDDEYIIECNLLHSRTQDKIHDPNCGFLSSLILLIKKIDPDSKFIIKKHNLKEKHLKSDSKLFVTLCDYLNKGDIKFENFENFKFDVKLISSSYCKISNTEKNSTIYLEDILNKEGWITVFSNHQGGEKSNILNIKNKTYYNSEKYTKQETNKIIKSSRTQGIPDLIVYKDEIIIIIEGKKNNKTDLKDINQQILLEINWFNQNIKQKQKIENFSIHYGISTFGGDIKILENNPNIKLNNCNLLMCSIFEDYNIKWWINNYKELPTVKQLV